MTQSYRWGIEIPVVLMAMIAGQRAYTAQPAAVLDAPYWRLGGGFQTTIMMNNTRTEPKTVTAYVYGDKGEIVSTARFSIAAMATKTVSLTDILTRKIENGNGFLELQFSGAPVDIA